MFVPLDRDLMSSCTTADFHCELNSPLSSNKLMILVIAGMQLCNTCLSSFVEIMSNSHDLVGMSIITLYSWSSVSVVNLLSAGVLYVLGVYGSVTVSSGLIFSIFPENSWQIHLPVVHQFCWVALDFVFFHWSQCWWFLYFFFVMLAFSY